MVVLVTDNDIYYELRTPGVTTIGRGSSNDVVPESRSISKSHAILTLQMSSHGKLEMWIEDLNSTNGTYLGSSPLEIHKISGKEKVSYGDYLRFGHSSQYFRILESMLPGTGLISDAQQDLSSEASDPNYMERSDEKDESSLYHNLDRDYEDVYQQEKENFSLPSPSKLHQQHQSRLSRSTPAPYQNSEERLHQEFQRRSAEYPRNSGKEHFYGGKNVDVEAQAQSKNRQGRGHESGRGSYSNHDRQKDGQNMTISINYPTSNSASQHPISVTIDPPRSSNKERGLWESPFSPSVEDENEGSQIFPESSQDDDCPSPLRFHSGYDYNIPSNDISNDPSINHSSIFNISKHFVIDAAAKRKLNEIQQQEYSDNSDNNSANKFGSSNPKPRNQILLRPDINLPQIKDKDFSAQNNNYYEKKEKKNRQDEINQMLQNEKHLRRKSSDLSLGNNSYSVQENYNNEDSDQFNSGLIQIPNKMISNRGSNDVMKNAYSDLKSNFLPAQKNTRDSGSGSQEWGFGLNFSKQNQAVSSVRRNNDGEHNVSNLHTNETRHFPEIFSIANIAQSIIAEKKRYDTNTSSISKSMTKMEKNEKEKFCFQHNFPSKKLELDKEGLEPANITLLLEDDRLAEKLSIILGPCINDKALGNYKGLNYF